VQIKPDSQKLIIEQVNYLVAAIQKLPNWPAGRNNGYCTAISAVDGRVLLSFQVGECPPEKVERYCTLSNEKAQRLRSFLSRGDVSSWQSLDEKADKFAGAISTGSIIFSFSGLPFGLADEAIVLLAAVWCNFMSAEAAIEVAQITGNKYFADLDNLFV
jgi:hypothetical protein